MKHQVVPYPAVHIDADFKVFWKGYKNCLTLQNEADRQSIISKIIDLFNHKSVGDSHFIYPCLSVRSALDAFFTVKNFPHGSEVIITAINIPDIKRIIEHHGLVHIPLDLDFKTLTPSPQNLEELIGDKTVAVIVAHLYGKQVSLLPLINVCKKYNILFIEDLAESFFNFDLAGNVSSDVVLLSFGLIKNHTAFGGAILKVSDKNLYLKILECLSAQPIQSQHQYFRKILKYIFIYILLDVPSAMKSALFISRLINADHKKYIVARLRGFPGKLFPNLRHQPCAALLKTLLNRLEEINDELALATKMKGDYCAKHLPPGVQVVGSQALHVNYWLFPVIVEYPNKVVDVLNKFSIDAFRGATQLTVLEPNMSKVCATRSRRKSSSKINDKSSVEVDHKNLECKDPVHISSDKLLKSHVNSTKLSDSKNTHLYKVCQYIYPHKAKYLIDHVIYLPINRHVPFRFIDYICWGLSQAIVSPKPGKIFSKL